MKREIFGPEARILPPDVEAEERRVDAERLPQSGDGSVQVRAPVCVRRAQVEGLRSARVGRMEVTAPGLDHAEALQVVKGERDRAVAARREPDQGTRPAIRNRPEVGVDVGRELLRDGPFPISTRPPVQVLRIRVVIPRRLRGDEDRPAPQAGERVLQEADIAVRLRGRGQSVQEVDNRVAEVAAGVTGGKQHDEAYPPANGSRLERGELGRWAARAIRFQCGLGNSTCRDQRDK